MVIPVCRLLFWRTCSLLPAFITRKNSQREKAGLASFFLIFWGVKGMEVDAFYRLQGYFFGYLANFQTILSKVLVDQFVYCIFWSAPCTAIFMAGSEQGLPLRRIVLGYRLVMILEESAFLWFRPGLFGFLLFRSSMPCPKIYRFLYST